MSISGSALIMSNYPVPIGCQKRDEQRNTYPVYHYKPAEVGFHTPAIAAITIRGSKRGFLFRCTRLPTTSAMAMGSSARRPVRIALLIEGGLGPGIDASNAEKVGIKHRPDPSALITAQMVALPF